MRSREKNIERDKETERGSDRDRDSDINIVSKREKRQQKRER